MKFTCLLVLAGVTMAVSTVSQAQAPDLSHADLVLQSVPDGPVAKVNGQNIERSEFISLYQTEIMALMARLRTPKIGDEIRLKTGVRTVRLLVQHELLYQEALQRKLSVTDEELKNQWTSAMEQFRKRIAAAQGKDPSEAATTEAGLSEDEILEKAGVKREAAREEMRKGILVRKMRDVILKEQNVDVTDAEVAKFFEEHKDQFKQPERIHLQRVFVGTRNGQAPFDDKKKAEARGRIENALKRVQAGESFEAVAKAVSEAPDKENGGDLGAVPASQLPPVVVEAASKMKPGDISGVIEGEQGYNFVKLIEALPGSDGTLDKAKDFIRGYLLAQKTNQALDAFCKPLVEKPGTVEVYLQLEKTLAANPAYRSLLEKMSKEKAGEDAAPSEEKTKPAAGETKKNAKPKDPGAKATKKKAAK